ncbi:molybdopterin synthase catalytic subunit [Haloplanus vescus]|uniref:Molybdopterin synthase catalytic subunit n=1 Tax=Haloplanus vescus TaxID=555874 RepID=A0A1H3X3Q5_9EURY|nr:molybdopterin synthase [Haloplanus vescus]SDZ93242.1 molybdopterin synthase catalytic subunit [Haloplanus vescus]
MKTLNLVGPNAVDLADRLVPRLDGRVATVETLPETAARDTDAGAAYGLSNDGSWIGAGDGETLSGLLDSLVPDYDITLTIGFDAHLPTVAIGDADPVGDVVATISDAESDLDPVLDTIPSLDDRVTLESLVQEAKASPLAERSGAIATFTGRVRVKDSADDTRTTHLEFEKYEGVAADRMQAIREELEARDGVFEVLMHHRTGVIREGEDIVFVVVLAGHREEAFSTVEDGINRLKDEVPIFKKESTTDEEFWIHEQA